VFQLAEYLARLVVTLSAAGRGHHMRAAEQTTESRYRSRSLWLDGLPASLSPRAPLRGNASCDVAIVGAGFTGLWTAYYLKRLQPDLNVLLLEREIAGFGPSGRNGGWVAGTIAGSWKVYGARQGNDAVLRAERETYQTVDEIGRVARSEGIECNYSKGGMLAVATSEPQAARLGADISAARQRGLGEEDWQRLDAQEVEKFAHVAGCRMAVYSPHCARIDPARLARGLAATCEKAGVTIYEHTEALQVAPGMVTCREGRVTADHIIRATESYTNQLPAEKRRYLPLYSQMIATEPLPEDTWNALGWSQGLTIRDRRNLFFYAQRTADGRLAIGGRGAPYHLSRPIDETNEQDPAVRVRLQTALRNHFPAAANAAITHHWGGPLAVPRDWCMTIRYDRRAGFGWAGGYSGHGVVASNISGRTLADLVLGNESQLVTLPWVGHRCRRWEPEPLRYLASQAIVRMLASSDRIEDKRDKPTRLASILRPLLPPT
jgi:glycine/D-amino acid oxidase-like deaminating enzyme